MIIVDTSVLIDFLKGEETRETKILAELERDGFPFYIPLMCVQEVLQGARDRKEWKLLEEYLLSQALIEPADYRAAHVKAAELYVACRRRGFTVKSSIDCFIAGIAIEHGAKLLHSDRDFDKLKKVSKLQTF